MIITEEDYHRFVKYGVTAEDAIRIALDTSELHYSAAPIAWWLCEYPERRAIQEPGSDLVGVEIRCGGCAHSLRALMMTDPDKEIRTYGMGPFTIDYATMVDVLNFFISVPECKPLPRKTLEPVQ